MKPPFRSELMARSYAPGIFRMVGVRSLLVGFNTFVLELGASIACSPSCAKSNYYKPLGYAKCQSLDAVVFASIGTPMVPSPFKS